MPRGRIGSRGLLEPNGCGRGWAGAQAIRIPGPGNKPPRNASCPCWARGARAVSKGSSGLGESRQRPCGAYGHRHQCSPVRTRTRIGDPKRRRTRAPPAHNTAPAPEGIGGRRGAYRHAAHARAWPRRTAGASCAAHVACIYSYIRAGPPRTGKGTQKKGKGRPIGLAAQATSQAALPGWGLRGKPPTGKKWVWMTQLWSIHRLYTVEVYTFTCVIM